MVWRSRKKLNILFHPVNHECTPIVLQHDWFLKITTSWKFNFILILVCIFGSLKTLSYRDSFFWVDFQEKSTLKRKKKPQKMISRLRHWISCSLESFLHVPAPTPTCCCRAAGCCMCRCYHSHSSHDWSLKSVTPPLRGRSMSQSGCSVQLWQAQTGRTHTERRFISWKWTYSTAERHAVMCNADHSAQTQNQMKNNV